MTKAHYDSSQTQKTTRTKQKDRQRLFFDEGDAEPGPDEGKIIVIALVATMLIIAAITTVVMYTTKAQ